MRLAVEEHMNKIQRPSYDFGSLPIHAHAQSRSRIGMSLVERSPQRFRTTMTCCNHAPSKPFIIQEKWRLHSIEEIDQVTEIDASFESDIYTVLEEYVYIK